MSFDMNLYRVTVTQTWSAEAVALVWAPDKITAQKWAEAEADFDIWDADAEAPEAWAKPEPIDEGVLDRMDDNELLLIMNGNAVELAEFQAGLSPERLEAMRIARIEANNGQLPLLSEVVA